MSAHVDLETLAAFAESTLPEADAEQVREHLVRCRSCTAAYADAVRYRAAWLACPEGLRLDRASRRIALGAPLASSTPVARRRWARRLLLIAPVTAALVAGLVAVRTWMPSSDPPFTLPPAVLAATRHSSAIGLVVPGTESEAAGSYPELRSGHPPVTVDLQREARAIIETYEAGNRGSHSCAAVVAALLATGEIDAARDYAREGLREHPNAIPLLVLAADASFRTNDLEGAEALLRRAASRQPADPLIALDLALVLRQQGREGEARALLVRASRARVPSLAARAQRELSQAR